MAAEWMGWENVFHCEWNPFGQKVLKYYWPNAISYNDITKTDFTIYRGKIDILTGGFPCQPYSAAGKRLGKEDDRHLWPEMLRAVREIQPTFVVGENVRGLTNWNGGMVFDEVQADLEAEGYEVTPFLLPACAVNAPHRRDRIWFVAYSGSNGHQSRGLGKNKPKESQSIGIEEERERIWNYDWGVSEQRTTADPNISTTRSPGKSGSVEGNWSANNDEQKQRGEQAELNTRSHELLRDATDTMRNGIDKGREGRQSKQFNEDGIKGRTYANTKRKGLEGSDGCESTQRERSRFSYADDWQKFPTQSPVCDGDDGLSSRLDGITFPKWRNESIKAGGNAIVPQVAFQIFKAINETPH